MPFEKLKNKKKKRNVGKYKTSLMTIITMVIVVAVTVVILCNELLYSIEYYESYTDILIDREYKHISDEDELIAAYNNIVDDTTLLFLEYASFYIEEHGLNSDNVNAISLRTGLNTYFVTGKGDDHSRLKYTITGKDSVPLTLSEEELKILCQDGSYEGYTEDEVLYHYKAKKTGTGYMILSYRLADLDLVGIDLGNDKMLIDDISLYAFDSDGTILSSTNSDEIGKKYDDLNLVKYHSTDFVVSNSGAVGMINYNITDSETIAAFVPINTLVKSVLRGALVPILLFWVVIITILVYVLKIYKERNTETEYDKDEIIQLSKNYFFDRVIVSHVVSIGIFGILLITIAVFYVRSLVGYNDQNNLANEHLINLSQNYNRNCNNIEASRDDIYQEYIFFAEMISQGFLDYPEAVNLDTLKKMVNKITLIEDIAITDDKGNIVASTANQEGYTVGKNEGNLGVQCWQVLSGELNSSIDEEKIPAKEDEEAKIKYTIVVRRQDSEGVIIVNVSDEAAMQLSKKWSMEETMITSNFGNATCMAVVLDMPEIIYALPSNAGEIEVINTTLNENILQNGFAGVQKIKGIKYYVNSLLNSDHNILFISAFPVRSISYSIAWDAFLLIVLSLALFEFLVIIIIGKITPLSKNEDLLSFSDIQKLISERNQITNERFKNVVKNMIIITGILLALLLALDYIIEEKPILVFLLGSEWNKGINLFSITMILFIMVGSSLGGFFLGKIIFMICNNMGSRGMTIGHLLGSISRFIILIIAIIWSLREMGFNLSALITGAGIAGAAISICANSTVNDLLSGFFIVFEGAFQIGDWIKVGDWRGQVVEIGMRTTKIAYGGSVKIVNNSSMKDVTVMDRTNSGALVRLDVAYKENINEVIELLKASSDRFRNEIPIIQDGPYVKGVVDLGNDSVSIEMYAFADQKYVAQVERGLRLSVKKLFDENNIEIPFNQVTIHNADEERHFALENELKS